MNRIESLSRTEGSKKTSIDNSKEFQNTKMETRTICEALTLETEKYEPQKSIEGINHYISSTERLDRMLYSEISNYIFSLNLRERGVFTTNAESLLLYSLDKSKEVSDDSRKIVIKIYDHSQLAIYQTENAKVISADGMRAAKEDVQEQLKGVEKEYISILGIFAAIVLAFVGGITFSTSVLQNISEVSIYRLLMVVDFLAFTLINIIYLLINCIFKINGKDTEWFKIKELNIACLGIAAVVAVAWMFNADQLSAFISSSLPWNR